MIHVLPYKKNLCGRSQIQLAYTLFILLYDCLDLVNLFCETFFRLFCTSIRSVFQTSVSPLYSKLCLRLFSLSLSHLISVIFYSVESTGRSKVVKLDKALSVFSFQLHSFSTAVCTYTGCSVVCIIEEALKMRKERDERKKKKKTTRIEKEKSM